MGAVKTRTIASAWPWLAVVAVLLLTSCDRVAAAVAAAPAAPASATEADPEGCPITRPPNPALKPPVPPAPSSALAPGGEFWYGTPALWTSLGPDGIWSGLPYGDAGFTQKVFWWSQGYDWLKEPQPPLVVTGRRMDGSAGPLVASTATNASADDIGRSILVGVDIPTRGCWEITGHLNATVLSFVVLVR